MIKLDFELIESKYTTSARMRIVGEKRKRNADLIFDPGSTMTAMSKKLFDRLGYSLNSPRDVTLRGINGESKAISTIIDYLEIGGVNLGNVRVVVGDLHESFEDSIILGVNVLVWYDYAVIHRKKQLVLVERKIKTTIPREERFISMYPQIMSMWASVEDGEEMPTLLLE
jgi:hypothetical protein